jgi:hypothetical protein
MAIPATCVFHRRPSILIAFLGLCTPFGVHAQNQPSDELDIQAEGPRTFGAVGIATRSEQRDISLNGGATTSIGGGIAHYGLSGSFWLSRDWNSQRIVGEALLSYSYKFPVVDAHVGYAICVNEFLPENCRDAMRLSLTTNGIKATTIEASVDVAPGKGRTITSLAVTRDVHTAERWSSSVRVGWTENRQDPANKIQGISARLIASYKLNEPLSLDLAVGHQWNIERHAYPIPEKSAFASLSLVMRR